MTYRGNFARKRRTVKVAPNGELYTTESDIQIQCVRVFRTHFRQYANDLFSIPNGARVGGKIGADGFPVAAKILKAEGMTAGVSDLLFAVPMHGFAGLFIEMKSPVGSLSGDQRDFLKRRAAVGYAVEVCKSIDEFIDVVTAYINGTFRQLPIWELRFNRKNFLKKHPENLPG